MKELYKNIYLPANTDFPRADLEKALGLPEKSVTKAVQGCNMNTPGTVHTEANFGPKNGAVIAKIDSEETKVYFDIAGVDLRANDGRNNHSVDANGKEYKFLFFKPMDRIFKIERFYPTNLNVYVPSTPSIDIRTIGANGIIVKPKELGEDSFKIYLLTNEQLEKALKGEEYRESSYPLEFKVTINNFEQITLNEDQQGSLQYNSSNLYTPFDLKGSDKEYPYKFKSDNKEVIDNLDNKEGVPALKMTGLGDAKVTILSNDYPLAPIVANYHIWGLKTPEEVLVNTERKRPLEIEYLPEDKSKLKRKWRPDIKVEVTSGDDVIRVDEYNNIIGLKVGKGEITVTAEGISRTTKVNSVQYFTPVTDIDETVLSKIKIFDNFSQLQYYAGNREIKTSHTPDGATLYYVKTNQDPWLFKYELCILDADAIKISSRMGPQGKQGPQGFRGYQGWQGVIGQQGYQGSQGDQGVQGPQGPQGAQGFQGDLGPQGYQGDQGPQGFQGDQGFQGFRGYQGYQGVQGSQGYQGETGESGPQGFQGTQGVQGPQGFQGYQGFQGDRGYQGFVGERGVRGDIGYKGDQGDQGNRGYQGWQGVEGAQGFIGDKGPQGDKGITGDQGPRGVQGAQGSQGVQGVAGPQGVQGPQGFQGIQGDRGSIGDKGYQGDKGPQGDQGPQGLAGSTGATGSQGPTGAAGAQGAQGVRGDQGYPGVRGDKGVQGDKGATGDRGERGYQGFQGATGPTGAQGAVGAKGAQGDKGPIGNQGAQGLTGPRGAQGVRGDQGYPGARGDAGVQGSTGAQGAKGSQGDKGAQGERGPRGDAGPTGPQGVQGAQGAQGVVGNPYNIKVMSLAEYNSLTTKDNHTLYLIK